MTLTYPKAAKLSVGYDPKEDRLFLIFHLQDGGFRKAFVSRRILGVLLGHMSEQLASSHPMAGYTAQRDEMLQMEHVASVSVQSSESKSDPGQIKAQSLPTEFPGSFYVTDAHVELQQDMLVVGFSGEWLNDPKALPVPIAALGLGRSEAHRVLRLLRDKADSAGWNMEMPAQWLKPLEYGKALGVH
ncbi:hypothetical protein [Desulfonatronum lacustre]|uniref:hypothetical protein n=1 Tax=Desulfonatronum lacustre TaxID=66849 RepID=UPI0004B44C81|nr:hypothetical protein [Desulfonatronum lacustre]